MAPLVTPTSLPAPVQLLALVQKPAGIAPHQRFRLEQWAPDLAARHGITVTLRPFESRALVDVLYRPGHQLRKAALCAAGAWNRWRLRREPAGYDGVVVVREASMIGGAWLESYLHRHGVPFVYDFDDAIWRTPATSRNGLMRLARFPWKVPQICRLASVVTVGNEYLAAFARQFNEHVRIVRTSVDVDRFTVRPEPTAATPFRVVWTGSHSTLTDLEHIRPAIERLGETVPTVLRVICDTSPAPFANVQLEFIPWRAAGEVDDLALSHVGIMPLPDTEWNRGKCGCKALQYMGIGRPVVVSPVGINREIVRDGENGLHAVALDDWVAQLQRLAADATLRARLGVAGRATVTEHFSARSSAAAFAGAVRALLEHRR